MTIIIPTRLERPSIYPLIEAANKVDFVILVYTQPDLPRIKDVLIVDDYTRNIQHWWNSGLMFADEKALILNDDIKATSEDLIDMLDQLEDSDLVYTGGRPHDHASPMSGWAFGLRPDVLRPDNAFQWWYGEDDIYLRAQKHGLRITEVPTNIQHFPSEKMFPDDELEAAVIEDKMLFERRWDV